MFDVLNEQVLPEGMLMDAQGERPLSFLTLVTHNQLHFYNCQLRHLASQKHKLKFKTFLPQNEWFSIAENEKALIMCSENVSKGREYNIKKHHSKSTIGKEWN